MKLFAIGGVAFVIMGIAALGGIAAPLLITLGVLILLVAHFFNFLLQSLGAGIHSLRLQFVELFGRFYEGGGKEYSPFAAERLRTALATNPEKS
jgi:V/A-type H+-transporting ATPase subunit I